jgi:hypothetical protein
VNKYSCRSSWAKHVPHVDGPSSLYIDVGLSWGSSSDW